MTAAANWTFYNRFAEQSLENIASELGKVAASFGMNLQEKRKLFLKAYDEVIDQFYAEMSRIVANPVRNNPTPTVRASHNWVTFQSGKLDRHTVEYYYPGKKDFTWVEVKLLRL